MCTDDHDWYRCTISVGSPAVPGWTTKQGCEWAVPIAGMPLRHHGSPDSVAPAGLEFRSD